MSLTEISLNIPTEHVANVFGQFDAYIKKIERTLNVTVVVRGDSMKLIGNERQIKSASNVFMQLLELSKRGNVITEQNVNYALSLAAEAKESAIVEIDKDCICHTINGKPVKPKTLGQKNYVDAIRQKMIVFGMGPAGTGKTYLAMAMAITAFKNEEVGPDRRSRQARNLDFCRETYRARSIRICARYMMRFIRSWELRASRRIWKKD